MRFATKQDIEAPIADVFNILSDFEGWERAAMRRGAEVARTDKLRTVGPGMLWATRILYRHKPRDIEIELTGIDPLTQLQFSAVSQAIEAVLVLDLMAFGSKRTRLHVTADVTPRSLTARLFLQSLRLARARVDRKFDQRIAQLAGNIETRYRSQRKY